MDRVIDILDCCFRCIGRLFCFIFLVFVLFLVFPTDIKNGYFASKNKIKRKYILYDKKRIAKKIIERMDIEYQERKKSSSEKMKILFQILTLVFTIISAVLAYLIKEIKVGINPIFAFSLVLFCISMFMVITYYNVSKINVISFPDFRSEDSDEIEYLVDRLFCIEMNNARLDYVVTIYSAALRYFYVAFILLLVALWVQFNSYFSWQNSDIKNQNISSKIQNIENIYLHYNLRHTNICKIEQHKETTGYSSIIVHIRKPFLLCTCLFCSLKVSCIQDFCYPECYRCKPQNHSCKIFR